MDSKFRYNFLGPFCWTFRSGSSPATPGHSGRTTQPPVTRSNPELDQTSFERWNDTTRRWRLSGFSGFRKLRRQKSGRTDVNILVCFHVALVWRTQNRTKNMFKIHRKKLQKCQKVEKKFLVNKYNSLWNRCCTPSQRFWKTRKSFWRFLCHVEFTLIYWLP